MWNLALVRSETVLVLEQDRCTVCAKHTIGLEIILDTHTMILLGDEAQVEARLVHLEMVQILTQDWCIVYAERTIGSKIILDTPDGIPR
jgi:hypothetical protein